MKNNLTNSEADRLIDEHFKPKAEEKAIYNTFIKSRNSITGENFIENYLNEMQKANNVNWTFIEEIPETVKVEWVNTKKESLFKRLIRKIFKL